MIIQRKIGDKCFYWDGNHFVASKIVKLTPSGRVTVPVYEGSDRSFTFNPDGSLYGGERWERGRYELDLTPMEEREASIAQHKRAEAAAVLITRIISEDLQRPRASWGKKALLALLERTQVALDAAKEAVEAI